MWVAIALAAIVFALAEWARRASRERRAFHALQEARRDEALRRSEAKIAEIQQLRDGLRRRA